MSIAMANRVRELEEQLAQLRAQFDALAAKVQPLVTPRPPGRPKKNG